MVVEAVAPGVTLAAEGDLHLAQVLAPQSPPGHGPAHLAPTPEAAPAPTHDPGPGVDPGHLGVALAPDLDHIHVHLQRDVVAPNPRAPPLPPHQYWVPLPPNHLQISGLGRRTRAISC